MITMTKKDCTLCDGSGFVYPYPYRKRVKCDHTWSRGSFMERFDTTKQQAQEAQEEHKKWERALESEIT